MDARKSSENKHMRFIEKRQTNRPYLRQILIISKQFGHIWFRIGQINELDRNLFENIYQDEP